MKKRILIYFSVCQEKKKEQTKTKQKIQLLPCFPIFILKWKTKECIIHGPCIHLGRYFIMKKRTNSSHIWAPEIENIFTFTVTFTESFLSLLYLPHSCRRNRWSCLPAVCNRSDREPGEASSGVWSEILQSHWPWQPFEYTHHTQTHTQTHMHAVIQ